MYGLEGFLSDPEGWAAGVDLRCQACLKRTNSWKTLISAKTRAMIIRQVRLKDIDIMTRGSVWASSKNARHIRAGIQDCNSSVGMYEYDAG